MLREIFDNVSVGMLALAAIGLVTVYNLYRKLETKYKVSRLGGHAPVRPSYLPFGIDTMIKGVRAMLSNNFMAYVNDGLDLYGNKNHPHTLEFTMAGQRIIFTRDDINIKAILATQFSDYGKGKSFNEDWHDFLGDSIFTTDGDLWHNSRQLIRPQFIKDRLSDIKIFEKHSSMLVPMLAGSPQDPVVDVMDLFFRFTLDAATDFLLGNSTDSLNQPKVRFAEAFNDVQRIQGTLARMDKFGKLYPRAHFNAQLKVINEFVEPYIEQALTLSSEELEKRTKTDEGYTFLHALAAQSRDRTFLRDQLVAVLLAGRDTTACTLSWLFYELSTRPDLVQRLRNEILTTVGPVNMPTYVDLKGMKFLTNCLNETLRLYPIVPFNVRFALKDTTLPHGAGEDGLQPVGILKGTPIGYSAISMQRRKDIYPPESSGFPPVDKFVPERWEGWTPKSWTYIPFNGGPRICVGQQFALTEMAYTITRILQQYEKIENCMPNPAVMQTNIVLQPAEPVLLKLTPVNHEK